MGSCGRRRGLEKAARGAWQVCWQRFLQPQAGSDMLLESSVSARPSASHWMQFPMDAWLRWYWPSRGDYYVVTATCEPVEFLGAAV